MITNFSVSMCVYKNDNPIWLKCAIDSILSQSIIPSEVIIVIDGPIDENLEIVIAQFETNSIFRIFRLPNNIGQGLARQKGLEMTSYNYVAIMDADDISDYNRFKLEIEVLNNQNDISIVGGQILEFIENPDFPISKRQVPREPMEIKRELKKRCPMNLVTVMFRKDDVLLAGGFQDYFQEEDYLLWIKMHQKNMKFYNLDDTLVRVRVGKDMYRRRGGWRYFKSELKVQRYLLSSRLINIFQFLINVLIRFLIQVILPNNLRSFMFRKFGRKQV